MSTSPHWVSKLGVGLVLLFFQVGWSRPIAADGQCFFTPECDGLTFHINKVIGLDTRQELVLRVYGGLAPWWLYLPENDWKDVGAFRCSKDHKCERASSARIWTEKTDPNSRRVVGKYEVDFGGQHFQGQFVAKLRKHDPPIECL